MERKHDRGFTLVELLIIIVILCILATIAVFAVRGVADQDQKSACIAHASQQTVTATYYPCRV
jgi:prepilin-type N-terminal cleavage/methylation domain-containing protein